MADRAADDVGSRVTSSRRKGTGGVGEQVRRIIVGMSGASGIIYGVRALQMLADIPDVETHLVVSPSARRTAAYEIPDGVPPFEERADVHHRYQDLAASISSGSFRTDGMIIAPCSIKTLSGIANSYDDNLLVRAADVVLKERRPLVLLLRETPLHVGHLRLMTQVAEIGAVIAPPVPAFYTRPETIDDIVTYTVTRALDQLGIELPARNRWGGAEGETIPNRRLRSTASSD